MGSFFEPSSISVSLSQTVQDFISLLPVPQKLWTDAGLQRSVLEDLQNTSVKHTQY